MIKINLTDDEVFNLKKNDILYDDLSIGYHFNETNFGVYYLVLDNDKKNEVLVVKKFNLNLMYLGNILIPLVIIETKHKNRIFRVKFHSSNEEAKFRLMAGN